MCLHHKHHLTRPTKGSEEGVGRFLVEAKGGKRCDGSLRGIGKGREGGGWDLGGGLNVFSRRFRRKRMLMSADEHEKAGYKWNPSNMYPAKLRRRPLPLSAKLRWRPLPPPAKLRWRPLPPPAKLRRRPLPPSAKLRWRPLPPSAKLRRRPLPPSAFRF